MKQYDTTAMIGTCIFILVGVNLAAFSFSLGIWMLLAYSVLVIPAALYVLHISQAQLTRLLVEKKSIKSDITWQAIFLYSTCSSINLICVYTLHVYGYDFIAGMVLFPLLLGAIRVISSAIRNLEKETT